jgi:hypothetical protein
MPHESGRAEKAPVEHRIVPPVQRVKHLGGLAIDKDEPGVRDERTPEFEKQAGPRVLPPPGRPVPPLRHQGLGSFPVPRLDLPLRFDVEIQRRPEIGQKILVEFDEVPILEVAWAIGRPGRVESIPEMQAGSLEHARQQRRRGAMHAGNDDGIAHVNRRL